MKYLILYTDEAKKDLGELECYFSNPEKSLKYIQILLKKVDLLEDFPNLGLTIHNSVFNTLVSRYLIAGNHIVYYTINELAKCIYINAIIHQSKDWQKLVNKDILNKRTTIAKSDSISICHMNTTMYYDVWRNSLDEDNRRFVPDEVFETLEEASEVVDQLIKCYDSKEGPFVYAVIRNSDNTNLGYVQLIPIEEGWEIGYHIAKRFTGHGYATEAVKLFLDYIKNNTSINELYGIVLSANKASRRVLEKTGFEFLFEGVGPYQGKRRKIVRTIKRF